MTKARIIKIAKETCWDCTFDDGGRNKMVRLYTYTPAGQEVDVELYYKRLADIPELLFGYWQDFDPSYEASLWLDENGHGKNGAPYDMGDVYKDMVAAESAMENLYDALVA